MTVISSYVNVTYWCKSHVSSCELSPRGRSVGTRLGRDCVPHDRSDYAAATNATKLPVIDTRTDSREAGLGDCLSSLLYPCTAPREHSRKGSRRTGHKPQCLHSPVTQGFFQFHYLKGVMLSSDFKELCAQQEEESREFVTVDDNITHRDPFRGSWG